MTVDQLKAAVAEKMLEDGVFVNKHLTMRVLCQKVGEHTGMPRHYSEAMYAYLARFADAKQITTTAEPASPQPAQEPDALVASEDADINEDPFVPQKATPPNWGRRRDYVPPMHLRVRDIDAAQPPMMTPDGVGNGTERQHGYGRGS